MTNGEKFKEVFGKDIKWSKAIEPQMLALKSAHINGIDCMEEWLNAEYKEPSSSENPISSTTKNGISNRTIIYKAKESKDIQEDLEKLEKLNEPTTKNCESCRHYGLHHEICNYCYKCSLWIEKEPTTKNNLVVREFEELVVEYPPEDLCIYPEYKGKPYFGIKYKENGEEIVGYGTYKPQVLSRYLKDYFMPTIKNDLAHNLCNTCTNKGCEFQSGIVRTKCAFYMPPQLEPDNCGNYVVQAPTTKNDLAVEKIIDEVEKEFEKVDIPIMDKLTIFAKVQNALYKCAVSDNSEVEAMTREDINDIINAICPNDEDYEKPCISPKYLRQELEQLALDQKQWNEEPTTKNELPHCQCTDAEIAKSFIEDIKAVKDQLSCGDQMDFPDTFDEFVKDYGFKDKDEIYTNGSELIPVFRVKQWLEHISTTRKFKEQRTI